MSVPHAEEWVQKAEEDYQMALAGARQRKHPVPSAVCFHCQQCAEKYLKAFLAYHDLEVPRVHNLLRLNDSCVGLDSSFSALEDSLEMLNPYGVEIRYPGGTATVEESQTALQAVKRVRRFLRGKFSISTENQGGHRWSSRSSGCRSPRRST